jgi:hypothetical protein
MAPAVATPASEMAEVAVKMDGGFVDIVSAVVRRLSASVAHLGQAAAQTRPHPFQTVGKTVRDPSEEVPVKPQVIKPLLPPA